MKSAQWMFLVEVEGVPGVWRSHEGGNPSSDYELDYDGGALYPDIIPGRPTFEDITVTRTFNPEVDGRWAPAWKKQVGRRRANVSVQPLDADGRPVGDATNHPEAVLIGVTFPGSDANSSSVADISLSFATAGSA